MTTRFRMRYLLHLVIEVKEDNCRNDGCDAIRCECKWMIKNRTNTQYILLVFGFISFQPFLCYWSHSSPIHFMMTFSCIFTFINFAPCTCHIGHFSSLFSSLFRLFLFSVFVWKTSEFMRNYNKIDLWTITIVLLLLVVVAVCCLLRLLLSSSFVVVFDCFENFVQSSVLSKLCLFQYCVIHWIYTVAPHSILKSWRCCNYYLHFIVHSCFSGWK